MYYHNQLLETEYQLNQDLIKEYFPLEKVTEGLLNVFSRVLGKEKREMYIYMFCVGMKFVSMKEVHVWHEDVKQFQVYDEASNQFMGHLYMDLFPRDGKYSHAAEFDLMKGFTRPNGKR